MKHPKATTIKLLGWIVLASIFTAFSVTKFGRVAPNVEGVSPIWLAVFFIIAFALGTLFWLKFGKKQHLPELLFSFGIAMLVGRAISVHFGTLSVLARMAIGIPIFLLYAYVIEEIKKGNISKWFAFHNAIIITGTVTIGGIVGSMFPPWIAICLFAIFAAYDAWAVWKTKHMVELAIMFVDKGIMPGIVQPYKAKENKKALHSNKNIKDNLALLGGGDTMFIAFIATSFARTDVLLSYTIIATMTVSLILLFWLSKPKKFYPALPYLFAGMLVAFPIWLVIR